MGENPSQAHGRLNEALHVAGYTIERAMEKFEWLLEDSRWMKVGRGFDDINDFMATVQLPRGIDPEDRARLAKKIKALQPAASQRKIAGALGVGKDTVARDLGTRSSGADAPPEAEQPSKDATPDEGNGACAPPAPPEPTGEEVAALAREKVRRKAKDQERERKKEENRRLVEQAPAPDTAVAGERFATLVMDPPWDWGDEGDVSQFGRGDPTYATMSIEDLLELPVHELSEEDAHLYLWITNRSLPKGFRLFDKWGFRYITTLTWVKPSIGMGNYFRGSTEQVLFGVRGSLPLLRKDVGTHFAAPRPGQHSAKPGEFYKLVESCSPGPWLELFARNERPGWVAWGAEVPA